VETWKALVGIAALALIAVAAYSLYWIACYETRVCPGDRQTYVNAAVVAVLALYSLTVIHLLLTKLKKK
jgi:hypothetical protein